MFCNNQLRGNIRDCAPNLGGLKELYIGLVNWYDDYEQSRSLQVSKLFRKQTPNDQYIDTIFGVVAESGGAFLPGAGFVLNPLPEYFQDFTAGPPLFKFDLGNSGAEVTSTPTVSPENGTAIVENRVTFNLDHFNAKRRTEASLLLHNELWAIARDNKGNYVLLGVPVNYTSGEKYTTTPLTLVEGPSTTGSALADANRGVITLQSFSNIFPPAVMSLARLATWVGQD